MAQPTILVIIGITGDLAKKKLLPAIQQLAEAQRLPENFTVVGITRQADITLADITADLAPMPYVAEHTQLFAMDLSEQDEYTRLAQHLASIEKSLGQVAQTLFYLSVPPQVSRPIVECLGTSGLSKHPQTKLLLEKPFGVDLASASELVEHIQQHFMPEQVYRIDHFLAKEMAQNMVTFRDENTLFKHTWNKDFIASIHITASESIDIEGRAHFYEQTGALRDSVQSHLLQLAALTLMDLPQDGEKDIPQRRLEALQKLYVAEQDGSWAALRGQYEGYATEVDRPHTEVETFAGVLLASHDDRWTGVPIILASGKAMQAKYTEVVLRYRGDKTEANKLTLRLQPDEGAGLSLQTKVPGYERQTESRQLNFSYEAQERLPEAYERVLLDAILSDHSLFTGSQEVLESWRIMDPVQKHWAMTAADLVPYAKGTDIKTLMRNLYR